MIKVTVPLTRSSSPLRPTYPLLSTCTSAEPVAGISYALTAPTLPRLLPPRKSDYVAKYLKRLTSDLRYSQHTA